MSRSRIAAGFSWLLILSLAALPTPAGNRTMDPLPIIPWPVAVERAAGEFALIDQTPLVLPKGADPQWQSSALIFADKVKQRAGISIAVVSPGSAGHSCERCPGHDGAGGCACRACQGAILVGEAIQRCGLEAELPGAEPATGEGYRMAVGRSVLIDAGSAAGLHNALMTLLQLIECSKDHGSIPAVRIEDNPRFAWRGMLLDSARSFLPLDVVKRYIDLMAELKLNRLHFHLVDDQGWRIESQAFPRLHQVGGIVSNMSEKKLNALAEVKFDPAGGRDPSGRYASIDEARASRGYYTREELLDLVAFAAARQVMIVPEIDIPGHCTAMLAAYPELDCYGAPKEVGKVGGLYRNALCPGKEEVYEFLDKLFAELAEIFPAPYVHIGSDEVWTTEWMDAPANQRLIQEHGYVDNDGLQSHFVERVAEILDRYGKTMIAWDEVTAYAPPGSVVQAWRNHDYARQAAQTGLDSVISPVTHCYIDYPQLQFTLKSLYLFEPIPRGLAPELQTHVLGGEVNLWAERVTLANIDAKTFPRLIGHAEVMWSPAAARDWEDFVKRLGPVRKEMKKRGVDFGTTWRDLFLLP